jgi:transmembrane sensor
MEERDFQALIAKYLAGEASPQEEYELRQWVDLDKEHEKQFEAAYASWEVVHRSSETLHPDVDQAWTKVLSRIEAEEKPVTASTRSLWSQQRWLRYAAAILLIGALAWLVQWLASGPETLIYRSTDQLAYHLLPDSSQIWLSPGGELTYTEGKERSIELKGTAYFDVKREESHPFVIQAGSTEVRVLGTAFSVVESDSAVEVWVSSGKVSFASEAEQVLLETGVKGTYSKASQSLNKEKAEIFNYLPQSGSYWVFENTPLHKVRELLQQHYGQSIVFSQEQQGDCTFTGIFINDSLEDILRVISVATDSDLTPIPEGFQLDGKGCP